MFGTLPVVVFTARSDGPGFPPLTGIFSGYRLPPRGRYRRKNEIPSTVKKLPSHLLPSDGITVRFMFNRLPANKSRQLYVKESRREKDGPTPTGLGGVSTPALASPGGAPPVACVASAPRVDFSSALATAVVETACALRSSERPAWWQADVLSLEAAWTHVDCTPYARQTRAAPALDLVKALLIAHDEEPDPVFWPNPGGRVGRTKPGETATQRQSRPREPQPWGWRQQWWGWRPPPPPRG